MAVDNAAPAREDECLSLFTQGLVTRSMAHLAEEARLDGESLKNAVDRYEIDYAWHVLGADRTQDAVLAALESRQGHTASDAQRAWASRLLNAAAAAQAADALMSFDNDVPELMDRLWVQALDANRETVAKVT